jgi:competence protein ComEC
MPGRWGEAPCAALALALAAGICAALAVSAYSFSLLAAAVAALGAAAVLALRRDRVTAGRLSALASFVLAGLCLALAARDGMPPTDARLLVRTGTLPLGQLVAFDGCVAEEVDETPLGSVAAVELRGFRIGDRWIRAGGGAQLRLPEADPRAVAPPPPLRYGDRVRGWAEWDVPRNYRNPGAADRAGAIERRGVHLIGRVKSARVLEVLPSDCGTAWKRAVFELRDRFRRRLAGLAAREAAILASIVLGDYSGLDAPTRASFQSAGTYHVLVVSGLHVGWISWALLRVLRWCRLSAGLAHLAAACAVAAYSALVGFQASISRCLAMFLLVLAGRALFRKAALENVVLGSAFVLLAAFPEWLFDLGFQLSYLSVLAVILLGARIVEGSLRPRLEPLRHAGRERIFVGAGRARRAGRRLRVRAELLAESAAARCSWSGPLLFGAVRGLASAAFYIGAMMAISLSAQLWLGPLLAFHFNRLSWISPLANIVAVPLSSAALAAGMAASLPGAGLLPDDSALRLAGRIADLLTRSTELVAALPAAWQRAATPHPAWVAAALSLLFYWCFLRWSRLWLPCSAVALLTAAIGLGAVNGPTRLEAPTQGPAPRIFRLVFLDVGQGDSIVLEFPDGRTWVFDAGGLPQPSAAAATAQLDLGEAVVSRYLWSRGKSALERVLLSHPHHDHAGGLPALMANFHPEDLGYGGLERDATMARVLQAAGRSGVSAHRLAAGSLSIRAGVAVETLNPPMDGAMRSVNDSSVVLRVRYGRFTALLTGDLERAGEIELLARGAPIESRLLKAAHHGSRSATLDPFLDRVRARWAVLSAGRHNPFGHPSRETLLRLVHHGVRPLLTLDQGAIAFSTDGENYVLQTRVSGVVESGLLPR